VGRIDIGSGTTDHGIVGRGSTYRRGIDLVGTVDRWSTDQSTIGRRS
jgi:hypothetical protein